MKSTRNDHQTQPKDRTSIPVCDVIRIIKSVRDNYVFEVYPEEFFIGDDICGEIISDIKAAAVTKSEGAVL